MSDWKRAEDELPAVDETGAPTEVLVELSTGQHAVLCYDPDDCCWFDPLSGEELLEELDSVEYWREIPGREVEQ